MPLTIHVIAPSVTEASTTGGRITALGGAASIIFAISLLAPFLGLLTGLSGVIRVIIVLVGLHQAWKQTAADSRVLNGPLLRDA